MREGREAVSAAKAKPAPVSQLPIGELAYRAYMKAATGLADGRPYEVAVPLKQMRRIWAEVETAIANNTIAMMSEILEKLGAMGAATAETGIESEPPALSVITTLPEPNALAPTVYGPAPVPASVAAPFAVTV